MKPTSCIASAAALAVAVLGAACARQASNDTTTELTSPELTSASARGPSIDPTTTTDASPTTQMVNDIIAQDYTAALSVADATSSSSPWIDYNRGVALGGLGRTDEALLAFDAAERGFGDAPDNRLARATAMYGRARMLDGAGRCTEAGQAYDRYAAFVRPTEPPDADLAMRMKSACKPR